MTTICLICGGWNSSRKLVYCHKCQSCAVHRDCFVLPSCKNAVWFCDDCKTVPTSDVSPVKSSRRLKKNCLNKSLKRKELSEKLNANLKRKSVKDEIGLSKSELQRQNSPLLQVKEVFSENHENAEKLEEHIDLYGGFSDKKTTTIEGKASTADATLPSVVPKDGHIRTRNASDRAKHDGDAESLRTKILKAKLALAGGFSDKKTMSNEGKASTADATLPSVATWDAYVQAKGVSDGVNCGDNALSSRTETLEEGLELDGAVNDEKTVTDEGKASTTNATLPSVVPGDGYICTQSVSVRAKHDGDAESLRTTILEAKLALAGVFFDKKTVSNEGKASTADASLPSVAPWDACVQAKTVYDQVNCGSHAKSSRTENLEVCLELDGGVNDKKTVTDEGKASTTNATLPSVVPEDGYIRTLSVSDRVKQDGVTASSRAKTSHLEADDHLNNPVVVSSDGECGEKDGSFPNKRAKSGATNDRLLEDSYSPLHTAQPITEAIWMGSFRLQAEGFGTVEGLMAHPSSLTSSKIREAATTLPALLSLEFLRLSSMWPIGSQKQEPSQHSINLYFFPSNERTEKTYDSLVDKMMSKQHGMKTKLKDAELLIFPSSILPLDNRRFQSKYYLWGMFSEKQPRSESSRRRSFSGERPCRFNNLATSRPRYYS